VRLNFRLLAWSLLVVAMIVLGVGGAMWWRNQPDQILNSAESYFTKAETARKQGDRKTALENYQLAETQLQNLLAPTRDPNNKAALAKRYKVLKGKALVLSDDEKAAGDKGADLPSLRIEGDANQLAERVAVGDPANFEAQAEVLKNCFNEYREHYPDPMNLEKAVPYAERLLTATPPDEAAVPEGNDILLGARFVLASHALASETPDASGALVHLDACRVLEQKAAKGGNAPSRWRLMGLRAEALWEAREAARADLKKKGAKPAKEEAEKVLDKFDADLKTLLHTGLERLRREMSEPGPRSKDETPKPVLTTLSITDFHGLFAPTEIRRKKPTNHETIRPRGFLGVAILDSSSPHEARERANLFTDATAVLFGKDAQPVGYKAATPALVELPLLLTKLPQASRPSPANITAVGAAVEKLAEEAEAKGGAKVNPDVYRQMAEYARNRGNIDETLRLAEKGVAAARSQEFKDDAPVVLQLHYLAAQMLMVKGKYKETEGHVEELRKKKGAFELEAALIEGRTAVQEGRLEAAVRLLTKAAKTPKHDEAIWAHEGLALAYLGMGDYARGLAELEKIEPEFKKFNDLSPEAQALAVQMFDHQATMNLEFEKCHLALGQMDKGMEYRSRLEKTPLAASGDFLLVAAQLKGFRAAKVAQKPEEAAKWLADARKLVGESRKLHPDNASLLWSEIAVTLSEPTTDDVLGVGAGPGVLRGNALAWARADKLAADFSATRDSLPAKFVYASWLIHLGRLDKAEAYLADLDKMPALANDKVKLTKARVELAARRGRADEAKKLAAELGAEESDPVVLYSEILAAAVGGDVPGATQQMSEALSKFETSGQLWLLRGQLARANGDFPAAVDAFSRAVQYVKFKGPAEAGLFASLLNWGDKAKQPAEAAEKARKLMAEIPDEPAVVLAYAELCRRLDKIKGDDGLEGALKAMKDAMARRTVGPAAGPTLAAREWNLARRPDLARKELDAAVKVDPKFIPALLLAGQTAVATGDWEGAVATAKQLEEVDPALADGQVWRAAALSAQGKTADAQATYAALREKFPNLAIGWTGSGLLLAKEKEYGEAVKLMDAWLKKSPADADALRIKVRALALGGQPTAAEAAGEAFLADLPKQIDAAFADLDKSQPTANEKEKEARAKAHVAALADSTMKETLATGSGLFDARLYDAARKWNERALATAEKAPEAGRLDAVVLCQLTLANALMEQGRGEKDPARKAELLGKAIESYQKIYQEVPGHFIAGNNLAWLLNERGESKAAAAIVDKLRTGMASGKPITGDRLPLEFLDTAGVVYRAVGRNEDAAKLFEEASQRYADEPQVYAHMARSQAGMGLPDAAFANFANANKFAVAQAERTADPERKKGLEQLAADVRREQEALRAPK
jgi:lipopolysaccharide biosynthesis regulator YciM